MDEVEKCVRMDAMNDLIRRLHPKPKVVKVVLPGVKDIKHHMLSVHKILLRLDNPW